MERKTHEEEQGLTKVYVVVLETSKHIPVTTNKAIIGTTDRVQEEGMRERPCNH